MHFVMTALTRFYTSLLTSGILLASTVPAAAMTVRIAGPLPDSLVAGQSYDFQIRVESFSPAWELVGGGVDLLFDPSVLAVDAVTILAPNDIGSGVIVPVIDNTLGSVSSMGFADFVGVSTDFALAEIRLRALQGGQSALVLFELMENPFAGLRSDGYSGAVSAVEAIDFQGGVVTVLQPVPLPASGWLFASAVGLLASLRRRAREVGLAGRDSSSA